MPLPRSNSFDEFDSELSTSSENLDDYADLLGALEVEEEDHFAMADGRMEDF